VKGSTGGGGQVVNQRNQFNKTHSSNLDLKHLCFAVDAHGYYLFACGFEDGSFIQYNIHQQRIEEEFHEHSDLVSCLALDENERKHKLILVTGSYDRSIIVWKGNKSKRHSRSKSVNYTTSQHAMELSMIYTKTNLDAEVNCVDVSVNKGIVIAATKRGTIYMFNSSKGEPLWNMNLRTESDDPYNITMSRVSKMFGTVLCYCCTDESESAKMYLISSSGEVLNEHLVADNDEYQEIQFTKSGNGAVCGVMNKLVVIYNLPSFTSHRQLNDANDVIQCIASDKEERYILSGLANGNVVLYSYPQSAQTEPPKVQRGKSLYSVKSSPFQIK